MEIPKDHQAVMPYLILKDASGFLDFTRDIFNAELVSSHMRDDNTTIMHAEIDISGSTIMFAESLEQWKPANANLFVYVANADETYHKAIAHGATSLTELGNRDYGRTAGITDPYGNVWWITSVKK